MRTRAWEVITFILVLAANATRMFAFAPAVLLLALVASSACAQCEWAEGLFPLEGVSGEIFGFTVFDDGSGPALYAAGDFTTAGGVAANRIAKWDGSSWSPLGSGMDYYARELTVFDDGSGPALYAGGRFGTAGGVDAKNIAKWDGTSWSPVGSGTDDRVYALTVFDDGSGQALYAGGSFTPAGGTPASRIARWDGTSWSPLGSGMNMWVEALTVFHDGSGPALYAGGFFTTAGGNTSIYMARWGCADSGPPVITISPDCGEYSLTSDECIDVSFSAQDDGSGLKSVDATLNGVPISSPHGICEPGEYVLDVVAEDNAGNRSEEMCTYVVRRPPTTTHLSQLYQAVAGRSTQLGNPISAVPGVLKIVPGENWSNYVTTAEDYSLKSVSLRKRHPQFMQCSLLYNDLPDVLQRGTNSIRLWWPLMYASPGTTWTLEVTYVVPGSVEQLHVDEWTWHVDTDIPHINLYLDLLHQIPFGTSQVPLLSDELLYVELSSLLDAAEWAFIMGDTAAAAMHLAEFELMVMDACVTSAPGRASPTGPGAGIAQTTENPACCALLVGVEYFFTQFGGCSPGH